MYGDRAGFFPVYTYPSCAPEVPVRATPSSPSTSRFPRPTGPLSPSESLPVVLLWPLAGSPSALVFSPEQHGPHHCPPDLPTLTKLPSRASFNMGAGQNLLTSSMASFHGRLLAAASRHFELQGERQHCKFAKEPGHLLHSFRYLRRMHAASFTRSQVS